MERVRESLAALPGPAERAPVDCQSGFVFGNFRLEPDGTLRRGATTIHLPPRELAALRFLLTRAGQIVSPQELRGALWEGVHVSADSLPRCLSSLRARLQPDECIQTVYKRGYRLTAQVQPYRPAAADERPRLAIVPFAAGYGVPEHLGAAVVEQTAAEMFRTRQPAFAVLAQDSVFTLTRRGLSAREIGAALKADYALAGTIHAVAGRFRLHAEMIRVEDAAQVWVEDVLVARDRTAGLETELASRLGLRLGAGLSVEQPAPGGGHGGEISIAAAAGAEEETRHREAYEIFQRAHHDWQTLERHQMQDALQHLLRATELDPALTGARVDLVNLCVGQAFHGYMAPAVAAAVARRVAEQTPEPPGQPEAMLPSLGWLSFHFDRDLATALRHFERSADLPHNQWVTRARTMFALSRHRFDEAIMLLEAAIAQDPYSASLRSRLAWALHLAGYAEESLKQARETLAEFSEGTGTALYGAVILAYNGEPDRAVKLAEDLERRLPYYDTILAAHAYALAAGGDERGARGILDRLEWLGRERYVLNTFAAAAYAALGEHDAAIAQLQSSRKDRCPWFFQTLADPRLKALHGRSEFEEMRGMLGEMEAAAEANAADRIGSERE